MELRVINMSNSQNFTIDRNSPNYAIEIYNLSKSYKIRGKNQYITALDNVNLKIKNGEIFGLLGPNGAGKTTMISILTTLIQPTSGNAMILGHNIMKDSWFIRENVGLMLGGDMIYRRLTGYRNLKFFCKLYDIKNYKKKIDELLEKFNLIKWKNQYVSKYSQGMQLKLALARVLLIDPQILFLDEPMLGLDPNSVIETIEILKNLNKTIFLTSHQLDIVSKLCDKIAFINEGKVIIIDTQENLKKNITEQIKIRLKVSNYEGDLVKALEKQDFISKVEMDNGYIVFYIKNEINFPTLINIIKDYPIIHFNELKPSLEDVFLKLKNS